jgi:abequosyltransferase
MELYILNKITLSIFVPTYNRAGFLIHLLESLLRDLSPWPTDFELVISDNASTDNTKEIVANFIKSGFSIIYVCNESNIGPDRNIAAGLNLVSGSFLWIIGDDEILYEGAVRFVLAFCRSNDFGLLHLANNGFAQGQQNTFKNKKIPAIVRSTYLDSENMFRQANIFLTFISANVINRQALLENATDFDVQAELNTCLVQLAWTYTALIKKNRHCYVRTPIFAALGENTSGYALVEVFGHNLARITKKYLSTKIPNAEKIIRNAVITRLLPRQLMSQFSDARCKNQFLDENIIEAARECFRGKPLYRIFLEPMLSTSQMKRNIAFFFVRVFNFLNRKLNYIFL